MTSHWRGVEMMGVDVCGDRSGPGPVRGHGSRLGDGSVSTRGHRSARGDGDGFGACACALEWEWLRGDGFWAYVCAWEWAWGWVWGLRVGI